MALVLLGRCDKSNNATNGNYYCDEEADGLFVLLLLGEPLVLSHAFMVALWVGER